MIDQPPAVLRAGEVARPVRAEVDVAEGIVHLKLIGDADRPLAVRYRLTIRVGGNEATQAGAVKLLPHVPALLLDLRQTARSGWSGLLTVTVEGGGAYTLPIEPGR